MKVENCKWFAIGFWDEEIVMGRRNKIAYERDDEDGTSFLSNIAYVMILCIIMLVTTIIVALWS